MCVLSVYTKRGAGIEHKLMAGVKRSSGCVSGLCFELALFGGALDWWTKGAGENRNLRPGHGRVRARFWKSEWMDPSARSTRL